jgi:hypothetical protein
MLSRLPVDSRKAGSRIPPGRRCARSDAVQMNAAALILLALQASIVLTVFALGLVARPRDAVSPLRRPTGSP